MHTYNYSTVINGSAFEICQTILAVEQYPDFLPFILKAQIYPMADVVNCKDGKLLNNDTKQEFKADLTIGYGGINYTYRSFIQYKNVNDQQAEINVRSENGIFAFLHNDWHIEQINDNCTVNFSLKFRLKSRMLEFILLPVLDRIAKQTIYCFKKQIYQKKCL